jgi:hypothetical protein
LVETLGEFETRPHAFLVSEIILESLRLFASHFLEVVGVRRSKLVDAKGYRVSAQPVGETSLLDVVLVVVVSQVNVLNFGFIMLREQLGNISIDGGAGSGRWCSYASCDSREQT